MRRILTPIALSALLVPVVVHSAPAAEGSCKKKELDDGSVITRCSGQKNESSSAAAGRPRVRVPDVQLLKAVSQVEGRSCTIYATPTSQQGQRELDIEAFARTIDGYLPGRPLTVFWSRFVESLPGCPSRDAEQVAMGFLVTLPLPSPAPYIAPGFALTGKRAYLETRASERETYSLPTPLGPLAVVATRTAYEVDWGDGSGRDEGPHPYPGEPWPEGRITHTYTDVGRYDVAGVELWRAEWALAGRRGALTGLRSPAATIEDFEVRQLQAVRNR